MPSKFIVRSFSEDNAYHVYNRGVEKRLIFQDTQDYRIFYYYLFIYLLPLEELTLTYPKLPPRLISKNLSTEVKLLSFCLMPNHFHLLLKQSTKEAISKLLKQLTNAYTLYFNQKYKRVGGLMQGPFQAVSVETDDQLIHLSRYIHLNPFVAGLVENLDSYPWSSYQDYVNENDKLFLDKSLILTNFTNWQDYKAFVLDQADYAKEMAKIKHLALDKD